MSIDKVAPHICVVLVNYHGHKDTVECIESLLNLDYTNFSVVVVDNSDGAESLEYIRNWLDSNIEIDSDNAYFTSSSTKRPSSYAIINESEGDLLPDDHQLTIIKAENKGFAAANNLAIKFLKDGYDWIWLLNNDTVVEKNCLKNFAGYVNHIKGDIGMIGTNLYYYHNPAKLQGIGGIYNKWIGGGTHLADVPADCGSRNKLFAEKVNYIMGASIFVSKQFIRDVGLMEETYFLYFEEIDWAIRASRLNYKLGYACTCDVYHKEGSTIGSADSSKQKSYTADFYGTRNKLIFTRKFYPNLIPIIYFSLIISVFLRLFRLQFSRINMIFDIVFK